MAETNNATKSLIEGGMAEDEEPMIPVEEFEKLLDQYNANVAEGEVVSGKVLHVSDSEVIVDVGYKSEGMINVNEFRDEKGVISVEVGDTVEVLLEKAEDKNGLLVLSREKAEKMKVWDQIEEAYHSRAVVKGRVIERIKGGLAVDIGVRAFLPGSQVDVRPVRNLDSLRGQELEMRVIKVNKKRGNIVLSRKVVLEEHLAGRKQETLDALEEGRVFRGVVKNLTDYGAFIDLGGIDASCILPTCLSAGSSTPPNCSPWAIRFKWSSSNSTVSRSESRSATSSFRRSVGVGPGAFPRQHEAEGQGREPHRLRRLR